MTTLREGIAEMAQELNERTPRLAASELRTWRTDHGMTQKQAAQWVGVSRRLWIRWEQPFGHRDHRPVPKWLRIIVGCVPATPTPWEPHPIRPLNEREGA